MELLSQQNDRRCQPVYCRVGLSINRNLLNSSAGRLAKNTEEHETTKKKEFFYIFGYSIHFIFLSN